MALNVYPSKRYYRAAAVQGITWGTAEAVGVLSEIICKGDGNPALKQAYESYQAIGRVMPKDGDLAEQGAIDFPLGDDMQYLPGALGSLIAGFYGSTYVPQPLFVVSAANNKINFNEGGAELTATVASGSYTATTLCAAIKAALEDAGALTFTVTFSTTTAKFTIAASGTFSLLWNTGTNKAVDISTMCGYSDVADDTSAATYTADTVAIGSAYVHTFEFADYTEDFFTIVTGRPGAVWEVPSAKPMKLAIKTGGGRLQAAVTVRGNTLTEASSVNGETQVNLLTPEAEGNFVKAQQGVLRMNAQSGDALDSGDVIANVSDVPIDLERTMDAQTCLGGTYIADPAESNFKHVVKVALSRAAAADVAYLSTFKAMTAQKMDLTFTGAVIAGTHTYKVTFGFPRLKFSGPPDCKLEDIIKNGLEFVAEEAATPPSGMTPHVRHWCEIVNTRSTAYVT
jgi:hypothetical protein